MSGFVFCILSKIQRLFSTDFSSKRIYNISNIYFLVKNMQTVIYADILIFLNSIITLFILLATSELLKTDVRKLRLITGSFLGGIFSLIILAPEMNLFLILITRFLISMIIIIITFSTKSLRLAVKAIVYSYLITVLFAGIISFIMLNFKTEKIYLNNGFIYFDIDILVLIFSVALSYLFFRLVIRYLSVKNKNDIIYNAEIKYNDKIIKIKALFDTGNEIKDIYTNKPTILVSIKEIECFFDHSDIITLNKTIQNDNVDTLPVGFRLIPIRSLGCEKLLPAFSADSAEIHNKDIHKILNEPSIVITSDCFDSKKYSAIINKNVLGEYVI